jgi:hypothetical protein
MVADTDRCLGRSATDDYFDAARETGRRRAEQRMPLDDVLRSFRLGGRLVWEALPLEPSTPQSPTDGLDHTF